MNHNDRTDKEEPGSRTAATQESIPGRNLQATHVALDAAIGAWFEGTLHDVAGAVGKVLDRHNWGKRSGEFNK